MEFKNQFLQSAEEIDLYVWRILAITRGWHEQVYTDQSACSYFKERGFNEPPEGIC
jgi:hypothetical protein